MLIFITTTYAITALAILYRLITMDDNDNDNE